MKNILIKFLVLVIITGCLQGCGKNKEVEFNNYKNAENDFASSFSNSIITEKIFNEENLSFDDFLELKTTLDELSKKYNVLKVLHEKNKNNEKITEQYSEILVPYSLMMSDLYILENKQVHAVNRDYNMQIDENKELKGNIHELKVAFSPHTELLTTDQYQKINEIKEQIKQFKMPKYKHDSVEELNDMMNQYFKLQMILDLDKNVNEQNHYYNSQFAGLSLMIDEKFYKEVYKFIDKNNLEKGEMYDKLLDLDVGLSMWMEDKTFFSNANPKKDMNFFEEIKVLTSDINVGSLGLSQYAKENSLDYRIEKLKITKIK